MEFEDSITGGKDSKWTLEKREVIHENPWYHYMHVRLVRILTTVPSCG